MDPKSNPIVPKKIYFGSRILELFFMYYSPPTSKGFLRKRDLKFIGGFTQTATFIGSLGIVRSVTV